MVVSPVSSVESAPLTPATAPSKPLPWPSSSLASVVSPIPTLRLPPRTLLPPVSTLLVSLRSKYPGFVDPRMQVPPLRGFVDTSGRSGRRLDFKDSASDPMGWQPPALDEAAVDSHVPLRCASPKREEESPQTSEAPQKRAGYSWERLQETIRRESRTHGLTNDEDEDDDEYNGCDAFGDLKDDELHDNDLPTASGGFYWTRSRGGIPT
ncbi:hypothetical protein BBJ28_00000534 [Nothophytophthora sp. Chile5]|nr:hypothetical protein BBJ28_00000534 [Nothophytophthora sp. Chile5]